MAPLKPLLRPTPPLRPITHAKFFRSYSKVPPSSLTVRGHCTICKIRTVIKNGFCVNRHGRKSEEVDKTKERPLIINRWKQSNILPWMVSTPKPYIPTRFDLRRLEIAIIDHGDPYRSEFNLFLKENPDILRSQAVEHFWNMKWRTANGRTVILKDPMNPYMK